MNIGIIGVGGVGGYFGGKLCQLLKSNEDLTISFVARGAHLEKIRREGLVLKTEKEGTLRCVPSLATDRIEDLPDLDLCILCVKGFDLPNVLERLKERIGVRTVVLPLLNGADVYDRVRSVLNWGIVLPACVYVGTHIEGPGVVAQRGGACKILFGKDPTRTETDTALVSALLGRAHILNEFCEDVRSRIWEKFIFINAFGSVTAAWDKTIGEVLGSDSLKCTLISVIEESLLIAKHLEIALPPNICDLALKKGYDFPFETKTSFQRDFEVIEKRDEREMFAGAIVSYAERFGLEVPETRLVMERLEAAKPKGW